MVESYASRDVTAAPSAAGAARLCVVRERATQAAQPPRLLEQVRRAVRMRHYSRRTEEAYLLWIRRFILFHGKRHPSVLGAAEVTAFLSSLAVDRRVSASTQNQALSAILFLYKSVLEKELEWLNDVVRAKASSRLPVVLTREEVRAVLSCLDGVPRLVATLLYGSGLRLLEGLRLRVKDVDFGANEIVVRAGKGDRDRRTMLPASVKAELSRHLQPVRVQHGDDLLHGAGWIELPGALARKYPAAGREWAWQWVFPATRYYVDSLTGQKRRHHLHESVIQRAVKTAVLKAGVAKPASCLSTPG
ncbi:MAG: integron integrase [Candidatus Eisenbacteria bacterium]|nr:integron integrase [Candidatus Eisenbacteria bacterium]